MSDEEAGLPFRWDLVTPDQLGSLLDGTPEPDMWFLDGLVACAGKVVARSGGGELVFVGRSLDSMFDLLSGALADINGPVRLARLPFSFTRPSRPQPGGRRWEWRPLTITELAQARRLLDGLGLAPQALARRPSPVVFTDVVHEGRTFSELFSLLRAWIDEERAQWDVIRKKLRFTGVTVQGKTSPNAFRWQQHAPWTRDLPASSVGNVSLSWDVWNYLGNYQVKLTRSFHPARWVADADPPRRDEETRRALAEAVALVSYGRSTEGRRLLARGMDGEPALAKPWLRSLVTRLNSGT
jgi:hypothetical protein